MKESGRLFKIRRGVAAVATVAALAACSSKAPEGSWQEPSPSAAPARLRPETLPPSPTLLPRPTETPTTMPPATDVPKPIPTAYNTIPDALRGYYNINGRYSGTYFMGDINNMTTNQLSSTEVEVCAAYNFVPLLERNNSGSDRRKFKVEIKEGFSVKDMEGPNSCPPIDTRYPSLHPVNKSTFTENEKITLKGQITEIDRQKHQSSSEPRTLTNFETTTNIGGYGAACAEFNNQTSYLTVFTKPAGETATIFETRNVTRCDIANASN